VTAQSTAEVYTSVIFLPPYQLSLIDIPWMDCYTVVKRRVSYFTDWDGAVKGVAGSSLVFCSLIEQNCDFYINYRRKTAVRGSQSDY